MVGVLSVLIRELVVHQYFAQSGSCYAQAATSCVLLVPLLTASQLSTLDHSSPLASLNPPATISSQPLP